MSFWSTNFTAELMTSVLRAEDGADVAAVESVEVAPGVSDNQNFLSQVLKVTVRVRSSEDVLKTRNIFVKYGEKGKTKTGLEIRQEFFTVEAKAYKLLEALIKWYKTKGHTVAKYWAECLHVSITQNVFMIMLQDLTEIGFKMMDKGRGLLDEDHVVLAVDRLARFHALTRVYLAHSSVDLSEWPAPKFDLVEGYYKCGLAVLEKAVRIYKKEWNYIGDYIIDLSKRFIEAYEKCYQSVIDDFQVLSLGDCWSNNIMFKYSNNKPTEARFVDFQFAYKTSFAWDLHYLIYVALLPKTRLAIIDKLLDTYHNAFAQTTNDVGGEQDLVPTREQINATMDQLLLPQFLYSTISIVELCSALDEDYESLGDKEMGSHIRLEWFLDNPQEKGFIDNIEYFEQKGLFK